MKKTLFALAALCLCALVAIPASATTVTGTLKDPAGVAITGTIYFALSQEAIGGGTLYLGVTVSCSVSAGVIQTSPACVVQGNDVLSPAGTVYRVRVFQTSTAGATGGREVLPARSYSITGATWDIGTQTPNPSSVQTGVHGASLHSGDIVPPANQEFGAFYADWAAIAAPANPASGTRRLFVNSATGELSVRTSAGTTVSLEGAGGGGGITTLNTLSDSTQTFTHPDDTNVTLTIASAAANHEFALGWTGTLAKSRTLAATVYTDQANAFGAFAQDFSAATLEIPNSITTPATCAVGTVYHDTDAALGSRFLLCTALNTFTSIDNPFGSAIDDSELASNYSGVGACTNQAVTATNDNAAPTCSTITSAFTSGTFDPDAHALVGAKHTASGLTAGHHLRATAATTFAFGAVEDGDLPASIARDSEINVQGTANEITSSGAGVAPTLSLAAQLNLSGKEIIGGGTPLKFEGATDDNIYINVVVTDPTTPSKNFTLPNADSVAVQPDAGAANNFLTAVSALGVISKAQPAFSNLSGAATDAQVPNTITLDNLTQITTRSHTSLSDIGTNSHATIDTHISATAAHGATGAVVGTTNVQTLTDKILDAGLATTTHAAGASFLSVLRHATDCTAITDGKDGELCWEADANTIYVCEPSAGGCDTAGEWTKITDNTGGAGGGYDSVAADSGTATRTATESLKFAGTPSEITTVVTTDDTAQDVLTWSLAAQLNLSGKEILGGATPLKFEGATDNNIYWKLSLTDPTVADKTTTVPNFDTVLPQPFTCSNQAATALSGSTGAVTCSTITSAFTSGTFPADAHNLLSASHGDTAAAAAVLGDILAGNSTPAWARLAGNTTTAKQFLTQTGNGSISALPAWGTIADGDLPASIARDSELHAQSHVIADTTGLGADHTTSGLTAGQVLRASGATTAAFASIQDADLPASISRDTESAAAGDISGSLSGGYTINAGAVASAELATANKTFTKSFTIFDPVTGDSNDVQIYFGQAVTITRVACSVAAATSVTIQLDERAEATPNTAGTNVMTAALVCDTDSQVTTAFDNAAIAARVPLNLQITAVTGTPGAVRGHIEYTID